MDLARAVGSASGSFHSPAPFPQEVRDLIGKDPEVGEEFEVEG